jgi:pimeloyl-ACP methyl ester carboxylesterase
VNPINSSTSLSPHSLPALFESTTPSPYSDSLFKLSSGRNLRVREFGNPQGHPVFHFHGIAGSGLDAALYRNAATIATIRLICPDRPGLGLSDPQPSRKILDWPNDIVELADHLGLQTFSVVGVSGGAPYALACAYQLPNRLSSCGIVSGAPPARLIPLREIRFRSQYWVVRKLPFIHQAARFMVAWQISHFPESFFIPPALLCPADAEVLRNREISSLLARVTFEGSSQGYAGPTQEANLLASDWGFRPEEIKLKKLFLWHGAADRIVPVSIGHRVTEIVPNIEAKFYPEEGHYSVMVNHGAEILTALMCLG